MGYFGLMIRILGLFVFYHFLFSEELVVGMELSYPPFEMVGTNGKPRGISVSIAESLSEYLGRPLQIENIPFVGLVPSLKTNKLDCALSSMTITPQRAQAVSFSLPYLQTGLCLLISVHSNLQNIAQANEPGRCFVVKSGTSGEIYAKGNLTLAKVLILDNESSCVLEVVQGKADAFIYDQLSVMTNWKRNPTTTRANLGPFQKEAWGIAVRKGNQVLVNQINAFIETFRKEGGFERLGDTYLSEQKAAFKEQGIPFVF